MAYNPHALFVHVCQAQQKQTHSTTIRNPRQGSDRVLSTVQLSPMGVAGSSLALVSACWYNYRKLQAMKAKQAPDIQAPSDDSVSPAMAEQKLARCEPKTGLRV